MARRNRRNSCGYYLGGSYDRRAARSAEDARNNRTIFAEDNGPYVKMSRVCKVPGPTGAAESARPCPDGRTTLKPADQLDGARNYSGGPIINAARAVTTRIYMFVLLCVRP